MGARMAIYTRIYGPRIRISLAIGMAMYTHIYGGSSNGYVINNPKRP